MLENQQDILCAKKLMFQSWSCSLLLSLRRKHYLMETSINIRIFFLTSKFSAYIKIAQAAQRYTVSDECFKFKIYLFLIGFEKEINLNSNL